MLQIPEIFLIKTEGGPHPGTRITDETQYPWPLPGILGDTGGAYIKTTESNAAPQEPGSRLVRGALYRWYSEDQIQEASSAQAEV